MVFHVELDLSSFPIVAGFAKERGDQAQERLTSTPTSPPTFEKCSDHLGCQLKALTSFPVLATKNTEYPKKSALNLVNLGMPSAAVFSFFDDILKLLLLGRRFFEFGCHVRDGFQKAQEITALHRVIHILRQRPARPQRRPRVEFGRHHAHHVPALIHQRPARTVTVGNYSRLHGGRPQGPDLEIEGSSPAPDWLVFEHVFGLVHFCSSRNRAWILRLK